MKDREPDELYRLERPTVKEIIQRCREALKAKDREKGEQ